MKQEGLGY
ncbi:hypothetical protein CP02DC22_0214A, partial [Chlamydia psittaci 02DC22]